ncbi:MAG TPA: FecR domain-containing protein [Planctomycetota bacterium]
MSDERLHAFLDGELAHEEAEAVARALAEDGALRARLAELRALDGSLRELYAAERGAAAPALARLGLPPAAGPRRRTLSWWLLPLAAAAGLAAGFLLAGRRAAPAVPPARPFVAVATLATGPFWVEDATGAAREARAGEFLPPGARVRAPEGVRLALVLEDGSELRLDRGSAVELVAARELVLETGRAWSRVEPGAPFRIRCGPTQVEVLGTELSVAREGERTEVQLFHGSARVEAGGAARALAAGQSARWDGAALSEPYRIQSEALATGWMLELYAYSGTHHKDLAEHLDRLLIEMGRRKLVSFEERVLESELAGVCRVPIARYLVSEGAQAEPEARRKAARVLETIADASVAVPLVKALTDPDPEVRRSAARVLQRLSGGTLRLDPERSAAGLEPAKVLECETWAAERAGVR